MKVVVTDLAQEDLNIINHYIAATFGQSSASNFLEKVNFAISLIADNPEIGRVQKRRKHLRGFIIAERTQILYSLNTAKNIIVVVSFFDVRQHPKRKPRS